MADAARFWDRFAERYARSPVSDEETYQAKLAKTQALMRPEMEVFEFGCGTGSTALKHASHVAHIVSTDVSPKMIEIARLKATEQGIQNVTFRRQDFDAMIVDEGCFDMVLGLNILHLLPEWRQAIRTSFRMLRPGGYFVTSTACLRDSMAFLRPVVPLGRAVGLLPSVVFFTQDDYDRRLWEVGFEITESWLPGPRKALFTIARKPD
ncbi:class I SAM-dependent methyltransferase [Qingshengfaniella alkalisoli]|uniref:Class I SAM-dependent methyltransferase n=1 Tax=Qingshengfaniella alkalisoli TaxID=2599296 RepID=A0A5B8J2N3_9RHOB|nr:class I SAM-dependent methyltransferase [Qingshengfaniella alkalisoli]QDY68777.1 class I SAM-dependent methyltransferase [Qingshengfaniella alkalisoli]